MLQLTADYSAFADVEVDKVIHLYRRHVKTNKLIDFTRLKVRSVNSDTSLDVEPLQEVPAGMRGITTDIWGCTAKTLFGLDHLEGETVAIFADGDVQAPKVVVNGSITLDFDAAVIHVGLPFECYIHTLGVAVAQRFEPNTVAQDVNVQRVKIGVKESRGFYIGPTLERMDFVKTRFKEDWAAPTKLKTEYVERTASQEWGDGSFFIRQTDPVPLTVTQVILNVEVSNS